MEMRTLSNRLKATLRGGGGGSTFIVPLPDSVQLV